LKPRFHAFTSKANGRAKSLLSSVHVCPAYDPATSTTHPKHNGYTAIWDTGATGSVITSKVVQDCDLKPIRVAKVHGVHGANQSNVYLVNIALPNNVQVIGVPVTEATNLLGADVLIGMDIITRGDFAITHSDGKTTFSFRIPSIKEIDFVKEAESAFPSVGRNDPCPCGSGKKFKKCCGS
jgi:predicted aspartyl protease